MDIDLGGVRLSLKLTPRTDVLGEARVTAVDAEVSTQVAGDDITLARTIIHESLEALSMAYLNYSLKHDDIELLEGPLATIFLALGWKPNRAQLEEKRGVHGE